MVWEYYNKPGNEVGGALHVVLDDGNLEPSIIDDIRIESFQRGDVDTWILASTLLQMTPTQRRKVQRTKLR